MQFARGTQSQNLFISLRFIFQVVLTDTEEILCLLHIPVPNRFWSVLFISEACL